MTLHLVGCRTPVRVLGRIGMAWCCRLWVCALVLTVCCPMQQASAAACDKSTISMQDSNGGAMATNFSFVPKSPTTIFKGKMVWTVEGCETAFHTFTSNLTGSIQANPGLVFTPTQNVSVVESSTLCRVDSVSDSEITLYITDKRGPAKTICTMTFMFSVDTTDSMSGANVKTTTIPSGAVFGTTNSTKKGPAGGSLNVVSATAYTFTPQPPCNAGTITPDTVELGTYSASMLNSDGQSLWKNFSVKLNSCYDLGNAIFTISYTYSAENIIQNQGTAGGVGVQLAYGEPEVLMASGAAFTPTVISTALGGTFALKARMKKVSGSAITAGSVSATATLTLTYP